MLKTIIEIKYLDVLKLFVNYKKLTNWYIFKLIAEIGNCFLDMLILTKVIVCLNI